MRNTTELQQRLIDLGYLPETYIDNGVTKKSADGTFGTRSLDAYNHYRASKGRGPITKPALLTLNADLFPEEQPVPVPKPPSIFDQIGTILSVIELLKGKTMTTDQIGGVIRAILTFLAGLAVAKGWLDNATALTIVGALVTILTAGWSVFTNRPAKIVGK